LALFGGVSPDNLRNGGFESPTPGEFWKVDPPEAKQAFSVNLDRTDVKEGHQSLLITADQPVHLTLRQEVFLPVGTLWRLTGWEKSAMSPASSANNASADLGLGQSSLGPRIGIEAQVGEQGFSHPTANLGDWQQESFLFRVPPPGRMTLALNVFNNQSGQAWLDDIRLEPVAEPAQTESVTISDERLSKRPIDLKQGGQFIEPLCDVQRPCLLPAPKYDAPLQPSG
jgi:hypothetical protein